MNPGKLNKRVSFLTLNKKYKNSAGEIGRKKAVLFSRWANVKSLPIESVVIEGKEYMKISSEITIRFDSNVTDNMSIMINGKELDIKTIDNVDDENKWLVIRCSKVV